MAETREELSGEELLCALAVGMELGCRLGRAAIKRYEDHVMGGWVYCSLHGAIVSAAVAGKLLGLTPAELRSAIGIAYHQAAGNGLAAFDGTDVRVFGAGFAARNGITAALLAQRGISGTQDSLDSSELSLMNLYHRGARPGLLLDGLGESYELMQTGFKAYPCCGLGHRQLDAVGELMTENAVEPDSIESITLTVPTVVYQQLCGESTREMPENTSKAQFHLPWQVACLASLGRLGLTEFQEKYYRAADIASMMRRVRIEWDPELADETVPAAIVIQAGGRRFGKKTEARCGSPEKPFSEEKIRAKLLACADHGGQLDRGEAEALLRELGRLAGSGSVRALLSRLPHGTKG